MANSYGTKLTESELKTINFNERFNYFKICPPNIQLQDWENGYVNLPYNLILMGLQNRNSDWIRVLFYAKHFCKISTQGHVSINITHISKNLGINHGTVRKLIHEFISLGFLEKCSKKKWQKTRFRGTGYKFKTWHHILTTLYDYDEFGLDISFFSLRTGGKKFDVFKALQRKKQSKRVASVSIPIHLLTDPIKSKDILIYTILLRSFKQQEFKYSLRNEFYYKRINGKFRKKKIRKRRKVNKLHVNPITGEKLKYTGCTWVENNSDFDNTFNDGDNYDSQSDVIREPWLYPRNTYFTCKKLAEHLNISINYALKLRKNLEKRLKAIHIERVLEHISICNEDTLECLQYDIGLDCSYYVSNGHLIKEHPAKIYIRKTFDIKFKNQRI